MSVMQYHDAYEPDSRSSSRSPLRASETPPASVCDAQ